MSNRSTTPRQLPDIATHCGEPGDKNYVDHPSEIRQRRTVGEQIVSQGGQRPEAGARRHTAAVELEKRLDEKRGRS